MKKSYKIMGSTVLLGIIIGIVLWGIQINKPTSSALLGSYQCEDESYFASINNGMTFTFDYDGKFYQFTSYPGVQGTYKKVGNFDQLLIFEDGQEYQIRVEDDAFYFPIKQDNKTILCKYTLRSRVPVISTSE